MAHPVVEEHCDTLQWFANEIPKSFATFSQAQKLVIQSLGQNMTYRAILNMFHPHGNPDCDWAQETDISTSLVQTCLRRSMLGLRWELQMSKDRARLLNAGEAADLTDLVQREGSLTVEKVGQWIEERRWQTVTRSLPIALALGKISIWNKLQEEDFSRSRRALVNICQQEGLPLLQPEEIEPERFAAGSAGSIKRWFDTIAPIVAGIPDELRFNMDEIMLAIGRSRKVFMTQEQRVFTCKIKKLPHYTLMVAMNRFGEGGKAKIVLPALRAVPRELQEFADHRNVTLAVSKTGWAGMNIFEEWASEFCDWLRGYRERRGLSPEAVAVLFVDGAPTHISLRALLLLRENHVICITFVPHCTHIMQPIDVEWARFFKEWFSKFYRQLVGDGVIERRVGITRFASPTARNRMVVLFSAVNAFNVARTENYCAVAWDIAGLSLVNWDAGVSVWRDSKFIMDKDLGHDPEFISARICMQSQPATHQVMDCRSRLRRRLRQMTRNLHHLDHSWYIANKQFSS
jgi:transposase